VTYIKLDDKITDHPKIAAAGPLAAWLFVSALCYSSRHLTDGAIHRNALAQVSNVPSPLKHAAELVKVGLFVVTEDGWQIHQYTERQTTRAEVESKRAGRASAGRKGAAARWQSDGKQDGKAIANEMAKPMANDSQNTENRKQNPTNSSVRPSVTRAADDEDPRIGEALALIAKARAGGKHHPQTWHDKVIANLRAEQNLDVEAARILENFDPPASTLAGALMGEDRRNLANYRKPPRAHLEAV
jgi:hypothetical protein